jgi:hypothetical protein
MTPESNISPPSAAERRRPRALWRSGAEREAAKAEARAQSARSELEAERFRSQRDVERIEADRERQRLQREAKAESGQGQPEKADVRKTDLGTRAAATIATIVAGQGMWQFLDRILGDDIPWWLRALMFAFLEIAVITSAIRARANVRQQRPAGVDGIAVWVLTSVSALLATLEAQSLPEALFRLVAPLVAAWLWERGMAIERHRIRGTSGINWRITPERVLVWFGAAEARDRSASEVDAHRRLKRVALAAKRVHQLRAVDEKPRKVARAVAKRDRMLDLAVAHTDVATNPKTQAVLLDLATTLGGAEDMSDLLANARAPWRQLDHPAITGAARHSEAAVLAKETRRLSDAVLAQRDPDAAATIEMLASLVFGRRIPTPGFDTAGEVSPTVADLVAGRVSLRSVSTPAVDAETGALRDTRSDTFGRVSAEVSQEVSDEELDAIFDRLREEEGDTGDDIETATPSATEEMRRHWDATIARGRVPSGPELAEAGGCGKSYGRRMRREWLDKLDGRTRRSLIGPKKASA